MLEYGTGAIKDIPDNRDLAFGAIAEDFGASNAPSFEEGYDVEALYGKTTQKDQNGSLSCVSQAWSYYAEMLERIENGADVPLSARYIYSQIHLPQGAAFVKDGASTLVSQGDCPEELCKSYPNDEQSLYELPSLEAKEAAKVYKAKSYASVAPNFDDFRKAIYAGKGMVTAFTGTNAGWRVDSDGFIRPPKDGEPRWGHCVWICSYKTINGRKGLKIKNSWGKNWGVDGYAWVDEEYFKAENSTLVFSGWTLVDLPNYKPQFMFNLIKGADANIYACKNGMKYLIVNLDTFNAGVEMKLWADISQVNTVTSEVLAGFPEGKAILLINNN